MKPKRFLRWLALAAAATGLTPAATAQSYTHDNGGGTVYTMSNAPEGNRVLAFRVRGDGKLIPAGAFPTGGTGTGGGLGNQGALTADDDFLLAVNPGSDDVSVYRKGGTGLKLLDRMASGGIRPVSVTVDRDRVYVLNAGSDSIAGFTLDWSGRLRALPGSEQGLSDSGVGAAQIQFSRDGRVLLVTEKATNRLVTFLLNRDGVPIDRKITNSPGPTPFGFALGRGREVLVSEAAGGAANASSVSSMRLLRNGSLQVLDPAVATLQSAACWVAITPDARFAYATNTASGTISGFRIKSQGKLELLRPDGVSGITGPGTAPIDMTISSRGQLLHVLNSGNQTITTFAVGYDGGLRLLGSIDGLTAGVNGLVTF